MGSGVSWGQVLKGIFQKWDRQVVQDIHRWTGWASIFMQAGDGVLMLKENRASRQKFTIIPAQIFTFGQKL